MPSGTRDDTQNTFAFKAGGFGQICMLTLRQNIVWAYNNGSPSESRLRNEDRSGVCLSCPKAPCRKKSLGPEAKAAERTRRSSLAHHKLMMWFVDMEEPFCCGQQEWVSLLQLAKCHATEPTLGIPRRPGRSRGQTSRGATAVEVKRCVVRHLATPSIAFWSQPS